MIWNKNDIQSARKKPLAPILKKMNYDLKTLKSDNFVVQKFGKLVVKNHYWIWYNCRTSGNTIDFFTRVENLSFHEAMKIITKK